MGVALQSILIFSQRNKYKSSPTSRAAFSSSQQLHSVNQAVSQPSAASLSIDLFTCASFGFSPSMADFSNEKGDMAHVDQKYAIRL